MTTLLLDRETGPFDVQKLGRLEHSDVTHI